MSRFLKITLIIISLCLFIIGAGSVALFFLLRNNGITYSEKNFDFPFRLRVKNIRIDLPDYKATLESFDLDLHPAALLLKRIEGGHLQLKNGVIEITATDTTAESSPINLKEIIPIKFNTILLKNIELRRVSAEDTLLVIVPEFYISNLNLGKTWNIDTLRNTSCSIRWLSRSNQAANTQLDTSKSKFTYPEIPEFNINNLIFQDGNLEIHSNKQSHSFTNFNLALSTVKQPENISMAITDFSLTYQDTLHAELNVNKILINKKEEVKISDLSFQVPGLILKIPKLDVSNPGSPSAHLKIDESSINTSLIKLIAPNVKLPLIKDAEIQFSGEITFKDNTCTFKYLALNLPENTSLTANGYADLPGKMDAAANIKVSRLHTSTSALTNLFGFKPLPQQKDINIVSNLRIYGKYDQLQASGTIDLNQNKTSFIASIDSRNATRTEISLDLRSRYFDSRKLFDSTGIDVIANNFRVNGKTTLRANDKISAFALSINSDSIRINENSLRLPEVKINYTPLQATASINLPNLLKLKISSPDNLLGANINFTGNLQGVVPKLNDLQEKAGELNTNFNGKFSKDKASFEFLLAFDTIRLKTVAKNEYLNNGILSIGQAENGELHLNLMLAGDHIVNFTTTGEFPDWWSNKNKWKADYPKTELNAAFTLDSNLIQDLTGRRGMIQLDNLEINAGGKEIEANLEISNLILDTLHLKDLKLGFESNQRVVNGQLTIAEFVNPYSNLEDVSILLVQKNDQSTGISIKTYLPEVANNIEINTTLTNQNNNYLINLNENDLVIGDYIWKNLNSQGFLFDEEFKLISGDLTVLNGEQRINVETTGDKIGVKIDTLHLHPLVELITNDTTIFGDLSLTAEYNVVDEQFKWNGAVNSISIKDQELGTLNFDGDFKKDLNTHFYINEKFGNLDLHIGKIDSTINYDLEIRKLDLAYLNAALPAKDIATVSGQINASVKGELDNTPLWLGYIHFDKFEATLTESKIYCKVDSDTLWFNGNKIIADNFRIYDKKDRPLVLDGKIGLNETILNVNAESFTVLDTKGGKSKIKGNVEISSDLTITQNQEKFEIKGDLNVLPQSNISYLYESTVSLDEREKELTFLSFTQLDHPSNDSLRTKLKRRNNPIEWDVKLGVGKSDISILLSETYQDNIKMTAYGDFRLKTGSTDEPFFFGNMKSTEGNIVYDAPMMSDVDLQIENLLVTWNGELSEPRVTFLGSELFRIVPKGIPGMSNTSTVVPVSVLVKVKDSPISNFQLAFDLNSTDGKVKSWIQSLPEDTREENAINLLLFGTLNFGETANSGYMQSIAAKMNELSRRNIKSADLTFYTESENVSETTTETQEKLGYNFSKGFFNKNVKVSFGGTLDFGNSQQSTERKSSALSNLQLEYILSHSPAISLTMAQKTIYDGIINGEIGESSLGISYLKRFRNFFQLPDKRKTE